VDFDLQALLAGGTDARASIGDEFSDAINSAECELDGCDDDVRDIQRWAELRAEAAAHWPALLALLDDPSPLVRCSGWAVIAALSRATWLRWCPDALTDAEWPARLRAAIAARELADPEVAVCVEALTALSHVDPEGQSAPWLPRARVFLAHPVAAVRAAAVRAVARDVEQARAELVVVCNDEDSAVEQAMIEAVGEFDARVTEPVLLRHLARAGVHADSSLVDRIKKLGIPAAREGLVALCVPESDKYARSHACEALAEVIDESCAPALHRVFALGDHTSYYAAQALVRLGPRAAHSQLARWITRAEDAERERPVERLVEASALLIAAVGDASHAQAMMDALQGRSTAHHYHDVGFALASLGHTPVFDWLERANRRNEGRSALAFGQLGDPRALPILTRMLHDRRRPKDSMQRRHWESVRRDCALAIASIDPATLDATALEAAAAEWPQRDLEFRTELTFAVRTLASRLAARRGELAETARDLVALLVRNAAALQGPLAETMRSFRGRGGNTSYRDAYAFVLRDWLADIARDLTVAGQSRHLVS
jgi:HEAT repeat protein